MSEFKIGAAIALDGDEQFRRQLKEIERSMSLTRAESKKLSAEFDDVGSSQEALQKKGELLQKQYDDQKKKLDVITEAVKKYEAAQEEIKERIDATKSALAEAERNLERAAEQYGKNSEEAKTAAAQVDELTQGLSRQEAQAERISTSLDSWRSKQIAVETQLIKTKKAVSDNESAAKKLSDNIQIAAQKMKDFGDSAEKAGEKIDKIGEKTEKLGGSLTASVTAPLVTIGTAAVASFNEVDDGLDIITQKTGVTGEQLKSFETIYKNIGSTMNAEFSDIGSAIGEISTRLELQGDALEQASVDFLKYARVNGTDVTTSIQLVSRAMGDASIESSQYSTVLDSLTKAGQMSGISVDKLAESLAKYGAPLRMLGYEIEDSIALFAAWEKAGVNTEIAFSGMRQAMGRWSAEGKDAQEEFAKLLQQLKDAPDLATAAAIATENFGTEAGNDLADAVRGGRFEVEKYTEALKNASGTLENTYAGMTDESDEAAIAMQEVKMALSDIGETILKTGAPLLKDLSEIVKEVGEWFDSLTDAQRENIVKWSALIAIGGPAISTLGKAAKGMGDLVSTIGSGVKKAGEWIAAAKKAKTATDGFETAAGAASGAMEGLGNIFGGVSGTAFKLSGNLASTAASLAGAAGIAATAVVAAAALADLAYKMSDAYKSSEQIAEAFEGAAEGAKRYADAVESMPPSVTLEILAPISEEEQEGLRESVADAQSKITELTQKAIGERGELIEQEISEIEQAYDILDEKLAESLEYYEDAQSRYMTRVEAMIQAQSGSAEKYAENAKQWLADAQSLYESSAVAIREAQEKEMSALEDMLDSGAITMEEYSAGIEEVMRKYENQLEDAAEVYHKTTGKIADGYTQTGGKAKEFFDELYELEKEALKNEKDFAIEHGKYTAMGYQDVQMYDTELQKIEQEYRDRKGELVNQIAALLSEENQIYLEHYLGMITTTLEQGNELTDAQKEQIALLISTYDLLEPEMQSRVKAALEGVGITFNENGDVLYTNAEGTAREVIAGWEAANIERALYTDGKNAGSAVMRGLNDGMKANFETLKNTSGEVIGIIDTVTRKKYEIRSPSRLMRRLGGQITEGFALSLKDNGDMVENASKFVMRIPDEEMQKLSLRAQAAGAMTLPAVPPQASRTQPADMDAFAAVMVKALKDAGLTVQMDAKTVGYLTAPAVGKQLGFDAKRGKRN